MTDNEIIKALLCCINRKCITQNCPYNHYPYEGDECYPAMAKDVLNLINRLTSKNEALKMDNEQLRSDYINANMNLEHAQAKIERAEKDHGDIDKFARDICKERMLKAKSIADFEDLKEYINKQKTEAIKEFANCLLKKVFPYDGLDIDKRKYAINAGVVEEAIKDLAEEMAEGQK